MASTQLASTSHRRAMQSKTTRWQPLPASSCCCECRPDTHTSWHPPRTEDQCKPNRHGSSCCSFVGKHSVCISLAPKSSAKLIGRRQPLLASTQFASASHQRAVQSKQTRWQPLLASTQLATTSHRRAVQSKQTRWEPLLASTRNLSASHQRAVQSKQTRRQPLLASTQFA